MNTLAYKLLWRSALILFAVQAAMSATLPLVFTRDTTYDSAIAFALYAFLIVLFDVLFRTSPVKLLAGKSVVLTSREWQVVSFITCYLTIGLAVLNYLIAMAFEPSHPPYWGLIPSLIGFVAGHVMAARYIEARRLES